MDRSAEAGRRFWQAVLTAGGTSALPRWVSHPADGAVEHEIPLDPALVSSLRTLAGDLAVSLSSILLAVHARVLATLCGQPDVVLGYVATGAATPLPCRVNTGHGTWRALLAESFCVETAILTHRGVDVARLRSTLDLTGPVFDSVVDPTGGTGAEVVDADRGVGLWIGVIERADRLVLRLRCRADVWDARALDRVGGYHLRALTAISEDVEAEHSQACLLSPDELDYQIDGLAGAHRDLPAARAHELIEAWTKVSPEATAAVCGERRWSYRELNAHANRLGRALLARGLRREGVVAVMCERNLDWMAAVLAVFKAGGVYLPIEPHFPPERITAMLSRADAQIVITQATPAGGLSAALDGLPALRRVPVDQAYHEDHPDNDLDIAVSADQLAYIYFTSGSTGEPKGAMCEHAGMLNHLYAKIADTGLAQGQVLAQTAPQCFDISLWQLLAAPIAGGTTLLLAQDTILDVARLLEALTHHRVAVVQLVPSYLEAVLAELEHRPRALPDLTCVSTTGEALKKELTVRWFAAQPDIPLLNAYGLTETSDDTNHELLRRPPESDRVPLGAPIPNVHVYVVDEHLQPVPLGAPGEIVYSGVCVGRGYVNDPERTAAAYRPDPHRPGRRLYRGGDIGRWLVDGKLEFLGRRDSQVKIRGFRIELGEVENALLQGDEVRDAAVVVTGTGHGAHLVAFYTGPEAVPTDHLRDRLARSLPEYMLPGTYHWHPSLPVTANGKIDHGALRALAADLDTAARDQSPHPGRTAPLTSTEQYIADAWEAVLDIPAAHLDRNDNFFDQGGTSLSAVKLAIILNRRVSLRDITEHPTLADLAGLVQQRLPTSAEEQLSVR